MKKLVKEWGKIRLLETSAVGIPVYPNAFFHSYSLIKALSSMDMPDSDKLNLEENSMESEEPEEKEEVESEDSGETESEEKTETEEKPEEKPEEKEPEEESNGVEKSVNFQNLQTLIAKGFKQAIEESTIQRGLIQTEVDTKVEMQKALKKMSIGELAVRCGLFKQPAQFGSSLEIA